MIMIIVINSAKEIEFFYNFHDSLNEAAFFSQSSPNPIRSKKSQLKIFYNSIVCMRSKQRACSKIRKIFDS